MGYKYTDKVIPYFISHPYSASQSIRILNYDQASFYWANGVRPVDIYPSKNRKTGKPCIVYVFIRDEQTAVYDLWVKAKEDA